MADLTIELEDIEPGHAWALAQMIKRMYHEDIRRLAVDDNEAELMTTAIYRLQDGLARVGYAPR